MWRRRDFKGTNVGKELAYEKQKILLDWTGVEYLQDTY